MNRSELEAALQWSPAYSSRWDDTPDEYASSGHVGWGRSRRLARLDLAGRPAFKAYLGVQHVDPDRAGWRGFDAPTARFFISWFVGGRCVALRTFPTMNATRDMLWMAYLNYLAAFAAATPER